MRIGVPRETAPNERRVAAAPDTVQRLTKLKFEVVVETGAGKSAGFSDAAYEKAGAKFVDAAEALGCEVVLKVQRPSATEVEALKSGAILISLMPLTTSGDLIAALAAKKITVFGMELVPRTTLAQSMDVLSSQATVAGYKAVLLGASALSRFLPMLTTAAGSIAPGKAFILGAGVAGLQAIATARRLGAVVSAFDVRPVVKEQVMSLGAKFVEIPAVDAAGTGGYAKELAEDQQKKVLETIAAHIVDMDLVITTAQIPGKPAPRMITGEMVQTMKPGSVIVDLAAETGGNCALTKAGETIDVGGVTIMGPVNIPSTIPFHASQMYGRNLLTLLQHITKDNQPRLDLADEIMSAMVITHAGEIRKK
jgi:NAD(P) transhydrogenase subunit alpha